MHPSLWVQQAPLLPAEETPPPSTFEAVVIGGGVAGVCCALHLARRGVSVVLLEEGVVAGRASGRNDGQVLLGLGEHYNRIVGQFGADKARLLWRFIRDNNDGIVQDLEGVACGFVQRGGLRLAETMHEATELTAAAALLAAEGIDHELVEEQSLRDWLPGAVGFHGALHLPGEACVQPAMMVRGLAAMARAAGARILQGWRVDSITGDAGEFTVQCDRGRVTAGVVVHCTSTLARSLDNSGFLARTVFPFRGQILATDPLPVELRERLGPYAMSSNFCYEYCRLHDGRFVVGGMRWTVKGEEQGILDDSTVNDTISDNLRAWVTLHFPDLEGVPFPHSWTGIMAGTGDGLPLVGALPGRPGVFVCGAFNGYGLSFAWLGARVLAEQVVDGASRHPAAPLFAPRRF